MGRFVTTLDSIRTFYTRHHSHKKFIPGIAWFFILLILLCLPGKDLPPGNNWMEWIFFDKWIHIGLFGLLTGLFIAPVFGSRLAVKKKWALGIMIVILVILWGYLTELIQHHYINGRSFDMYDCLADSVGATAALVFCRYFFAGTFNYPSERR